MKLQKEDKTRKIDEVENLSEPAKDVVPEEIDKSIDDLVIA